MMSISTRGWVNASDLTDSVGAVKLCFERHRTGVTRTELTVTARRGGVVTARAATDRAGDLWLAQRLRRGMPIATSSGTVTLRRNGMRPLKRQRAIEVSGPSIAWRLTGTFRRDEMRDEDDQLVWQRVRGEEQLAEGLTDEQLCVFGMLMNGHTRAAIHLVPALTR